MEKNHITIQNHLKDKKKPHTSNSLKKLSLNLYTKTKSTFKCLRSSKFSNQIFSNQIQNQIKQGQLKLQQSNEQKQNEFNHLRKQTQQKFKNKVRFRQSILIEDNIEKAEKKQKKNSILTETSEYQSILKLQNIFNKKNVVMSIRNRKKYPKNYKILVQLMNSPVQSKITIIQQLKCFMCNYPDQNSVLFNRKTIQQVKQRLKNISSHQTDSSSFHYDQFQNFLKLLNDFNYDSINVVNSYETIINKYKYPISIKLMLYYLGAYLYQLNNLYNRSKQTLNNIFRQILKFQLYEYVGIYLILMVKFKSNLLEWDLSVKYLIKLLFYSWFYQFQNLQVWVYFELSRSYFFLNMQESSLYFKIRSEMSILQPKTSFYRELKAKQFFTEMLYIRTEHQFFNLNHDLSIYELIKINHNIELQYKDKDQFKLQNQIKNIHEHCKIKHVKNLFLRLNQDSSSKNHCTHRSNTEPSQYFAGNPLLRTHQSGLKNLKIYFRKNPKGQTLSSKNQQARLYTFQNSNKNILALKQLCRNILLEMKWFVPIKNEG